MPKTIDPAGTYVVMGLARSGLAAARALLELGCRVRATDSKNEESLSDALESLCPGGHAPERLELALGGHPLSLLDGAAGVILSPGIPLTVPFLREAAGRGIPVLGEVEFAFRLLQGRILAITGSNGKSTTTAMVAHLLTTAGFDAHAAGNIGTPLAEFIGRDTSDTVFAAELSSFQLESVETFHPRVAAILNITPDHLDRYDSMEDYARAKWRIFQTMGVQDAAVLNASDARLRDGAPALPCPVYFFDPGPGEVSPSLRGSFVRDGQVILNVDGSPEPVLPVGDIPLPGRHNLENVLAATLICRLAGVPADALGAGVRSFQALPHRLQPVCEICGRSFYNDSKATNVDSTLLALQAFERPIVVILGGKDKGSPYTPLLDPIRKNVRHCILIGQAADRITEDLGPSVPQTRCSTMGEAVRTAFCISLPGDVVLLSPACSSYDMFDHFEHRGSVFISEVEALSREVRK